MSKETWDKLSSEDKASWDQVTEEGKTVILGYQASKNKPINANSSTLNPSMDLNVHDLIFEDDKSNVHEGEPQLEVRIHKMASSDTTKSTGSTIIVDNTQNSDQTNAPLSTKDKVTLALQDLLSPKNDRSDNSSNNKKSDTTSKTFSINNMLSQPSNSKRYSPPVLEAQNHEVKDVDSMPRSEFTLETYMHRGKPTQDRKKSSWDLYQEHKKGSRGVETKATIPVAASLPLQESDDTQEDDDDDEYLEFATRVLAGTRLGGSIVQPRTSNERELDSRSVTTSDHSRVDLSQITYRDLTKPRVLEAIMAQDDLEEQTDTGATQRVITKVRFDTDHLILLAPTRLNHP